MKLDHVEECIKNSDFKELNKIQNLLWEKQKELAEEKDAKYLEETKKLEWIKEIDGFFFKEDLDIRFCFNYRLDFYLDPKNEKLLCVQNCVNKFNVTIQLYGEDNSIYQNVCLINHDSSMSNNFYSIASSNKEALIFIMRKHNIKINYDETIIEKSNFYNNLKQLMKGN